MSRQRHSRATAYSWHRDFLFPFDSQSFARGLPGFEHRTCWEMVRGAYLPGKAGEGRSLLPVHFDRLDVDPKLHVSPLLLPADFENLTALAEV